MDIVFEFLFEVVGQIIFELFGNALSAVIQKLLGGRIEDVQIFVACFFSAILGAALGFASLKLYGPMIHDPVMQIVNLVVTPVLLGCLLGFIGRFKKSRSRQSKPLESFGRGYSFALAFALTRLLAAG